MSGKDKKGQRSGAGNSHGRNFGKWSHKNRQKGRFDNGEKDDSLVASRGNRPGAKPILHPDSAFSKRLSKISAPTFANVARIIGEVDEKILKEMAAVCVEGHLHHTRSLVDVRLWVRDTYVRALNMAKASDRRDRDTDRSLPKFVPLDDAAPNYLEGELFDAGEEGEPGEEGAESTERNISRAKLRMIRLFIFAGAFCADEELLRSLHVIMINNMQPNGWFSARAVMNTASDLRKAIEVRVDSQNEQLNSLSKMSDALKILQDFERLKGEDLFQFSSRINGAHASCIRAIKEASVEPADAIGAVDEPEQSGRATRNSPQRRPPPVAPVRRSDAELKGINEAFLKRNWAFQAANFLAFIRLRRGLTDGECPFFKGVDMEFDSLQQAILDRKPHGLPGLTGNVSQEVDDVMLNSLREEKGKRRCRKCGRIGHLAVECRSKDSGGKPLADECSLCKKKGHRAAACTDFECYRCHKKGHLARDCSEEAADGEKGAGKGGGRGTKRKMVNSAWTVTVVEPERVLEVNYSEASTKHLARVSMDVVVAGRRQSVVATLDSGSTVTLISRAVADKWNLAVRPSSSVVVTPTGRAKLGVVRAKLLTHLSSQSLNINLYVLPDSCNPCFDMLLGLYEGGALGIDWTHHLNEQGQIPSRDLIQDGLKVVPWKIRRLEYVESKDSTHASNMVQMDCSMRIKEDVAPVEWREGRRARAVASFEDAVACGEFNSSFVKDEEAYAATQAEVPFDSAWINGVEPSLLRSEQEALRIAVMSSYQDGPLSVAASDARADARQSWQETADRLRRARVALMKDDEEAEQEVFMNVSERLIREHQQKARAAGKPSDHAPKKAIIIDEIPWDEHIYPGLKVSHPNEYNRIKELVIKNIKRGTISNRPGCFNMEPIDVKFTGVPRSAPPQKFGPETAEILKEYVAQVTEYGTHRLLRPGEKATAIGRAHTVLQNGKMRVTLDSVRVNEHEELLPQLVPSAESIVANLAGNNYFSSFDLVRAFHQLRISYESALHYCMYVPGGILLSERATMGGKNFVAQLQAHVEKVFAACDGRKADNQRINLYVDDCLTACLTILQHVADIEDILDRMFEAGGTFSLSKLRLGFPGMQALGNFVNKDGRRPLIRHLSRIAAASIPTTEKDSAMVLGLMNYYRDYVPKYAELTKKVRITKKGPAYADAVRKAAFAELQRSFDEVEALAAWTPEDQLVVQSDASDAGVGFVLLRFRGNLRRHEEGYMIADDMRPIKHWSRSWTPAQKNWPVFSRELFGVVAAIDMCADEMRAAIPVVVVQTDQRSILFINSSNQAHCVRWRDLYLKSHRYKIEYIPGKDNLFADALSRYFLSVGVPSTSAFAQAVVDLIASAVCSSDWKPEAIWIHASAMSDSHKGYDRIFKMLKRSLAWSPRRKLTASPSSRYVTGADQWDVIILAPKIERAPAVLAALLCNDKLATKAKLVAIMLPCDLVRHARRTDQKAAAKINAAHCIWYPEDNVVWVCMSSNAAADSSCIGANEASRCVIGDDGEVAEPVQACSSIPVTQLMLQTTVDWTANRIPAETAAMSKDEREALVKKWNGKVVGTDGVFYFVERNSRRLFIPLSIRSELCRFMHVRIGHIGESNSIKEFRRRYWWPGMGKDVKNAVRGCVGCTLAKARHSLANAPMHSREVSRRHERTHADLFGPFGPDKHGIKYLLVLVDAFDGHTRLFPLKSKSAIEVAQTFMTKAFYPAIPDELASDDDPTFVGKVLAIISERLGISRMVAAPNSQWQNGCVEAMMKTIGFFMKMLSPEERDCFSEYLDEIAFMRNATPNSRTGVAPIDFDLAGHRRTMIDVIAEVPANSESERKRRRLDPSKSDGDVVREAIARAAMIRTRLALAISQANDHRRKLQEKAMKSRSKKDYAIGDKVVIFCASQKAGVSKKFLMQFRGPYTIQRKLASNKYEVRSCVGGFKPVRSCSWQNMAPYRGTDEDLKRYVKQQRESTSRWSHETADGEFLDRIKKGAIIAVADPDEGGKASGKYWLAKVLRSNSDGTVQVHYLATTTPASSSFRLAWIRANHVTMSDLEPPDGESKAWTCDAVHWMDVFAAGLVVAADGKLDSESLDLLSGLEPVTIRSENLEVRKSHAGKRVTKRKRR